MGIVIEFFFIIEQSDDSHTFEEGNETWAHNSPRGARNATTPSVGRFPMHNDADVHFESPKVPVIFVLGKLCLSPIFKFSNIMICTFNFIFNPTEIHI